MVTESCTREAERVAGIREANELEEKGESREGKEGREGRGVEDITLRKGCD